jgi:hypothetical protein
MWLNNMEWDHVVQDRSWIRVVPDVNTIHVFQNLERIYALL